MKRERLPDRRESTLIDFEHQNHLFSVGVSAYPDNRVAEIFISSAKTSSPIEAIARDAAVILSIAAQYGADLDVIYAALTKEADGSPASLIGAALAELMQVGKGA
jgi:hypothetical protein